MTRTSSLAHLAIIIALALVGGAGASETDVARFLKEGDIDQGLAVHLGTGDGGVELALAASGKLLVQGLSADAARIDAARKAVASTEREGFVTFQHLPSAGRLPYNDRLVDLLIADLDVLGAAAPAETELRRVVRPLGVIWLGRGGTWTMQRLPMPEEMGEWSHADHAADGNPQSADALVAAPRGMQWQVSGSGGNTSGIRLAGCRWFRGTKPSSRRSQSSRFEGRSAFNGLLLWRREEDGVRGARGLIDDRAMPKAVDARTGAVLATYADGLKSPPVPADRAFHRNVLSIQHMLVDGSIVQSGGVGETDVTAIDPLTGTVRWRWSDPAGHASLTVAGGGRVYVALTKDEGYRNFHYSNKYALIDTLVAIDLAAGKEIWRSRDLVGWRVFNLVFADGGVFATNGGFDARKGELKGYEELARIDAATGRIAFRRSLKDVKIPNATDWTVKLRVDRGQVMPAYGAAVVGFDWRTGEPRNPLYLYDKKKDAFQDQPGFCSTVRGTAHGIVTGKFARFLDLRDGSFSAISVTRNGCDVGSFPAYGMIYSGDDGCGCTSWLRGQIALNSVDYSSWRSDDAKRLERGPAWGQVQAGPVKPDDWTIMLGNAARSGASATRLGDGDLKVLSTAKIPVDLPKGPIATDAAEARDVPGRLTPPVVGEGLMLAAATHQHRLHAFDAVSGEARWTVTLGARIDTPPTLWKGHAFVGCRDGWCYALRLSDGALAWRFLAAPAPRQIVVSGQLESATRVHGSVLVFQDKLYVSAGRHNQIEGGVFLWRLDPATGATEASATIDGRSTSVSPPGPSTRDFQAKIHDLLGVNFSGKMLNMTSIAIDPRTLGWAHTMYLGSATQTPPAPGFDIADAKLNTFIYNNSVGSIDRRVDYNGSKGMNGYRYLANNGYQGGIRQIRIIRDGTWLGTLDRNGVLRVLDLLPDGTFPVKREEMGKPLATLADGGAWGGFLATADAVCVTGYGEKDPAKTLLWIVGRDGKARQAVTLPRGPVIHGLAAAGGRIYVATEDGSVTCLGR